ncbi:SCO family protein [Aquirufa rosea]|uniref:SCO family protein n=1 Tax=Aquirufa rosea TaxID=2509241 RepID=A0A4Q1C050_9BACT|nr:SCO family protein [Aquirufa rosea]
MPSINIKIRLILLLVIIFNAACQEKRTLPILGHKDTVVKAGKVDTIYHQIPAFQFLNQDSVWISDKNYEGKIYIADFFFTSCPTICPKMKTQMLRLYERYANQDQIGLLSFSIDPEFDRPNVLKAYASRLHIQSPKWNLVTGEKAKIYELGQKSFMVTTQEDKNEAGGFVHSGAFILVDKQRHVRGIYDGTKEQEVNHLMEDIELLLKEK